MSALPGKPFPLDFSVPFPFPLPIELDPVFPDDDCAAAIIFLKNLVASGTSEEYIICAGKMMGSLAVISWQTRSVALQKARNLSFG